MEIGNLSDETKKIRKSLLLFCAIGFSLSQIGLSIGKISLFGSVLYASNIAAIPIVLGLIVLYYLVSFIVVGLHEYSNSYRKSREEYITQFTEGKTYTESDVQLLLTIIDREISEFQFQLKNSPLLDDRNKLQIAISEKNQEKIKYKRILDFLKTHDASLFEKIKIDILKNFVDLFLPVLIGIYVCVILFFFTHIPYNNELDGIKENKNNEIIKTDSLKGISHELRKPVK